MLIHPAIKLWIIILIKFLSDTLNLTTVGLILEYIITWGPLALIIIFQPEIRNVLEQLGRSQLLGRHNQANIQLLVKQKNHLLVSKQL